MGRRQRPAEPGPLAGRSGGGFESDVEAKGFELSDVVACLGGGVEVSVVVVGAEIVEPSVGVGEQVPDDHQHGASDRDHGFLLATTPDDASVASAEEGIGPTGRGRGLADDRGEVAVPCPVDPLPWSSRPRT